MQNIKQCAGCGAQMGARSRVCPRCGRGSLFGELGMIAVLGVLLLGIGLASGLVPLDTVRKSVGRGPADTVAARPNRAPAKTVPRRPKGPRREQTRAESVAAYMAADSHAGVGVAQVVAAAPCSAPDTELVRRLLEQPGPADPARIAALACGQEADHPPDTAHVTMPEPPPFHDTAAAWPADSPTAEPPAF